MLILILPLCIINQAGDLHSHIRIPRSADNITYRDTRFHQYFIQRISDPGTVDLKAFFER